MGFAGAAASRVTGSNQVRGINVASTQEMSFLALAAWGGA